MNSHAIMAIPGPHLLILELLLADRNPASEGLTRWMDAVPDDLKGMDAKLLFAPLLQRGLIEDGSAVFGQGRGGDHFVRITAAGMQCYAFGFMPLEAVPVNDAHLDLMSHAPSPQELAESTNGELIVVDEVPDADAPDAE